MYNKSNLKYYYINLNHRTDRNKHMINQFKSYNIKNYERIEGCMFNLNVENLNGKTNGRIGCTMSHIKTLETFINSEYEYCVIFEDDFLFTINKEEYSKKLEYVFKLNINWDVILFSSNVISSIPYNNFLHKALNCQTTSSYLVTKKYAEKLLKNYIEGLNLLKETQQSKYCIDMYWKKLQPDDNWYVFKPKIGKQMPSYSDISKGNVNHEC
jgi:GR25 family glycosyltransferase involved in LPS biosynthesis